LKNFFESGLNLAIKPRLFFIAEVAINKILIVERYKSIEAPSLLEKALNEAQAQVAMEYIYLLKKTAFFRQSAVFILNRLLVLLAKLRSDNYSKDCSTRSCLHCDELRR